MAHPEDSIWDSTVRRRETAHARSAATLIARVILKAAQMKDLAFGGQRERCKRSTRSFAPTAGAQDGTPWKIDLGQSSLPSRNHARA
jgi:hypothetical protein